MSEVTGRKTKLNWLARVGLALALFNLLACQALPQTAGNDKSAAPTPTPTAKERKK